MSTVRLTPSFKNLSAGSPRASAAARASSKKSSTRCEVLLRQALWKLGLRYRLNYSGLPGRPDVVFPSARVVVFCDGDFWHGRDLDQRLVRLAKGHNAPYWTAKVKGNVARDQLQTRELAAAGWVVLRFWESDILRAPDCVAQHVADTIAEQRCRC